MGKKWERIVPAEIKVGDRVRQVDETSEYRQTVTGVVTYATRSDIEMGGASLSPSIGAWYVRKPKPAKLKAPVWAEPDKYGGHGVDYWHNRYVKQLAHSEQLQVANKNRRQKMQLLKKKAKDARRDVDGWAMRYAALAASINELPDEPTPPAPLTRPDEPPLGTFFRVERTGETYVRVAPVANSAADYLHTHHGSWWVWGGITEPGDTITMLKLVADDE